MKISVPYKVWLKEIKDIVSFAKSKAALSVNEHLLLMYWQLGQMIVQKQKQHLWGDAVIEQLSLDLQKAFPEMKGFSRTNLFNCKKIFLFYTNTKVQQPVGHLAVAKKNTPIKVQPAVGQLASSKKTANSIVQPAVGQLNFTTPRALKLITQIPWSHNIIIIEKTNSLDEALFYIAQTIENNWSKNLLLNQLSLGLYKRKGKAITNFSKALPAKQYNIALQALKDPYIFDFLSIQKIVSEKNLEDQLINHITKFLLELGKGFAFVGKQYHVEVSKKDYYIDLLFYHLHLRCYVVIELKMGEFKPEYAGKLSFYLSAIDDLVANKTNDNATIGIILCKEKDNVTAEYAVRGLTKPIGIAQYDFIKSIPKNLKSELPTIAQLEKELKNINK
jgi:predicted nuclease of restriction endonuclease-like (RecB) superfamily